MTAGYSGTPLAKKLGLKEGFKIRLVNQPSYYFDLFTDLPANFSLSEDLMEKKDFIHYFSLSADELAQDIKALKDEITSNGLIWISWPKKASKIVTTVSESVVRESALKAGLVDVKVCAVDEVWSALKLVIPVNQRK